MTFVSSGAKLGGEERYLELLLAGLGPDWIAEVVFLEHGPFEERLRGQGYTTQVLPTSRRARGIARTALLLRRRVRRLGPRLVHANGVKGAVVSALGLPAAAPFVWVKHDFSWDGPLARLVGRRARAVVAVTSTVAATFGARTRRKVRVVHNAMPEPNVDRAVARERLLDALGAREGGPVLALAARIEPTKGHRELLAIAPALVEAAPGLRIAFLGLEYAPHLGYAAALRAEVREAGLDDVVSFLGYREDAVELLAGADLVVVPTVVDERGMGREGFSYVALEAMAVGTPVVAYGHGGLPELVGDCARLVPPGERAALLAAIRDTLADEAARERMAQCGRERVASGFSLERMVDEMKDVYRRAAKPA